MKMFIKIAVVIGVALVLAMSSLVYVFIKNKNESESFIRVAVPDLINNCNYQTFLKYLDSYELAKIKNQSDIDGLCKVLSENGVVRLKNIEYIAGGMGYGRDYEGNTAIVGPFTVQVALEKEIAHINLLIIKRGFDLKIIDLFVDTKNIATGWHSINFSYAFDPYYAQDTQSPYNLARCGDKTHCESVYKSMPH